MINKTGKDKSVNHSTMYIHSYLLYLWGVVLHTTKVFLSGNSQAVRLPKEYNFNEKELLIQRIGNTIILKPIKDPWASLRISLSLFTEDVFSDDIEQPDIQARVDI